MVQFTKLRLSGFKSFIEATEVPIEPGITGIVGPNGCGKSNLVEALRWVMGETSAKRMRGGEMDDVIFSGSVSRPARNFADVVLALDNSDHKAPAMFNDFDDIEVERKIERGSGSTYRVNGREVRARDVQLLFADAATGAHSTALVSQGRVGALINAKPTQRRALLEEAAGITGLHSRRHEAELRLKAAETNLERLDDVISTLDAQLQSLKKQARQAARYRNLAGHIRRHEAILLHLEIAAAERDLSQARAALKEAETAVVEATRKAAEASTEQSEAAAALPPLRQGEAAAAVVRQRLEVERENLEREEAQVAAARIQAGQRRNQIDGDRAREEALAEDAAAAQTRLEEERGRLDIAAETEAEAHKLAEQRRNSASASVAEAERRLEELAEKVAADDARAASLARRIEELGERVKRLSNRTEELESQRKTLAAEQISERALAEAAERLASEERAFGELRNSAEASDRHLTEARARESEARERLRGAEATAGEQRAERSAILKLLEAAESNRFPPLIDALSVEPGYETALGAALGDDIIAPADEAAPLHWRSLPPLESAPPLPAGSEALSAFVKAPPVLARRLSQIGVVAGEASGESLRAALAVGQRLVSRQGGLWRWDGFTAKAEAPTAAGQRLRQRSRLGELTTALELSDGAVADATRAQQDAQRAAEQAAAAERQARDRLSDGFAALDAARQKQAALAQQAAAAASRLSALEDALEQLSGDRRETEEALAQAEADREALPPLDQARARLGTLRSELSEERRQFADCQSAVDRLEREAEARSERLAAIAVEKNSWSERSEAAKRHLAELDSRRRTLEEEIAALAERPAEIAAARQALIGRIEEAAEKHRATADKLALGEARLSDADRRLKAEEQALAACREERVRIEAAVGQAEQTLAHLAARVRERLDCAPGELAAVAELDPSQELPARDEVDAKLQRLLRERDNMGPVNLRAEAEAEELEQRIAGMQSERSDLVAAIGRLRQGISSLNREGRERLLAAFEQVNSHFSELFVRLFGGGRAHLALTEAEDPLEAGLEIMASPPGKRLQVMSLLSGGEQALTALSLLFAVFLTNPAPICVLDEVDAPLDDSNVDRFCSLVEELAHSTSTRFLVITHHRMTMSRVDRLYGVTMSERGVSQLVSVDLMAAERLRESA